MAYKDVFVPVFGDESDGPVIDALDALPLFSGAHVAVALMASLPDPVFVGDAIGGGMMVGEFVAAAHAEAKAAQARLLAHLTRTSLAYEQRLSLGQVLTVCDNAMMQARHADITVMARPTSRNSDFRHEILEAILMTSGRPLLLLPPGWSPDGGFRNVFIGWNASREAARAVGDAGPILAAAAAIGVGTVDARPGSRGHGEQPGVDIATHLARHGLAVDLQNLDSLGADKSAAIIGAAEAAGADLLVLGGYGHARVREALFGGVTRTLIDASPIPLFLSH